MAKSYKTFAAAATRFVLGVFLVLVAQSAFAANAVYVGILSAGANDGTSCANRKAASYFNTAGNWSASPTGIQIGPDTTVHFCGADAFAVGGTGLQFQGSGTSGHPVTLLFESGADLVSPAMLYGIDCAGKSFLTINGGSNGIIENTANGDLLANQQVESAGFNSSAGANSCKNILIENLTVRNIYIRSGNAANDSFADDTAAINDLGDNSRVTNNTLNHANFLIGAVESNNLEIDHNTFFVYNHAVTIGTSVATTLSTFLIHDNVFQGGTSAYDDSVNNRYHRNNLIVICESPGLGGVCVQGIQYYGNYQYGVMSQFVGGGQTTSEVFLDDYPVTIGYHINGTLIYNNVFATASPDTGIANGFVTGSNGVLSIYDNLFISNVSGAGSCLQGLQNGSSIVENNIFYGCSGVYRNGAAAAGYTINHNLWFSIPATGWDIGTYAQWQTPGDSCTAGCDTTGSFNGTDPQIVGTLASCVTGTLAACKLAAASFSISKGVNLTSLGIATLNADAAGVARPGGSTAWDLGPFQFSTGGTAPGITTTTLPGGTVNVAYSQNVSATGTGTITWTIASGSLPAGLSGCNNVTGSSCTISGTPTTANSYTFTLQAANGILPNAQQAFTLTINAPAVPGASLNCSSNNFGNQFVGTTSAGFACTLTNNGTAQLLISAITPSGDFADTSNCPISPAALGISNFCTITSTFTPTITGLRTGSISITDNAPTSPQTIALTGTGVAPLTGGVFTGTFNGVILK